MQKDNKFFDDMAKLASSAAGEFLEMKREMDELISLKLEKLTQKMNLGTKEEYQTLLEMMAKIREEQENISKRLDSLESRISK